MSAAPDLLRTIVAATRAHHSGQARARVLRGAGKARGAGVARRAPRSSRRSPCLGA